MSIKTKEILLWQTKKSRWRNGYWATYDFSDEVVEKAADLIAKQGYVTRNDIPEMKDLLWADAFGKKMDEYFLAKQADRFIYYENFDYVGGEIDAIIFDMNQVKTRDDALHVLGKALGLRIVDGSLDEIEKNITN